MAQPIVRWKLTLLLVGLASVVVIIYESVEHFEVHYLGLPSGRSWMEEVLYRIPPWGIAALGAILCGYGYMVLANRRYNQSVGRLVAACRSDETLSTEQIPTCSFTLQDDHMHALAEVMESYAARHRKTLEDLRKANDYLYSIIKESPAAIYILDLEGRIIQVNPAFESLYGYPWEAVKHSIELIVPERLAGEPLRLIERVRSGHPVNGYETWRRTSDGREIQVSLTISPIRGVGGDMEALAVICRNITEHKETEERLRRSEKLSVVGQLAAGVAHEIRNPLTTLRGFVQLFRQKNIGKSIHLDLMLEELDRINLIVSEFIVLSKPHLNQYLIKDVGVLLQDMVRFMEPQANLSNIMMETWIEPTLPKIRCEENQLKQVFLNIIKNGMEAMPDGGTITLEARRAEQGYILIRIRDRGMGIPEELLTRLGEPFITSKEHGTGLGIMVSQQILANHKGQMVIRSELGKGTCVDILMPEDFEHGLDHDSFNQKAAKPA